MHFERVSQVWVSQLPLASGSLLEFQQYIDIVQVNEESSSEYEPSTEPPSKKAARVTRVERGDDEELHVSKMCTICYERPLKTLFANCGRCVFVTRLHVMAHIL